MKTTLSACRHCCRLMLSGLLLACLPLPALALDWYTVEILVFSERSDAGLDEEAWSADPGLPDIAGALEPGSAGGEFEWLAESTLELSAVARQLDRSGRYRTLLLTGWRQPGYGPRGALPVHVRSDPSVALIVPEQPSAFGFISTDNNRAAVEGVVRVHRSRYLHVLVDLLYSRPAENIAVATDTLASTPTPTLFRLTHSRRMRSREMHYYDHPLFGVLVKITPYGNQQEAEPVAEPDAVADEDDGTQPASAD